MKKPLFVGIAGGSASGKSTISNMIEQQLSQYHIKVFHMDDYFKPAEERPLSKAPVTGKMYRDDNHPETINFLQLYIDLNTALNSDYDMVLLEGLFVLWDEDIFSRLDLKLFVDCKTDERIVRRLRRNLSWGLSFDEISDVYLDLVRYHHDEYVEPTKWKADFILNGSNLTDCAVKSLIEIIKSKI